MHGQRKAEADDRVWRALSNPLRRAMLDALREGPLTTGELGLEFQQYSRFAIMQHLRVLVDAELVYVHRDGRKRYNYLNPIPIQLIYDRWVGRHIQPWADALVDLRNELESKKSITRGRSDERNTDTVA